MIVGARGPRLLDDEGREYLDLCAGYGSVWLGHGHPAVRQALASQLERYAAPGYLPEATLERAQRAFLPFLPAGHFLGGIYSTGMEAVETALRAARAQTGRTDVAGFVGSEHGRSFLTAAIGSGQPVPFAHTLPGFAHDPGRLLAEWRALVRRVPLAAVLVEPIQMTGGGHALAEQFGRELLASARAEGIVVIFDEALTAPHRCGARYFWQALGEAPDIVVLGKGIANGFPASALTLRTGVAWDRERVRPGSTYWNHPLACVAVAATLETLAAMPDIDARVAAIGAVVRERLGRFELRGRGAMWCLGSPRADRQKALAEALLAQGVVVSYYDRYLRLLPTLDTSTETLASACDAIAAAHVALFG